MVCKKIKVSNAVIIVVVLCIFSCLPAMGYAQTKDVNALIKELKDKAPDVRKYTVSALGELVDTCVIVPLIATLKDTNPDVREEALTVLKRFKTIEAAHIEVLDGYCNRSIAEEILNCGATVWEDVARVWAEKHDYKIVYEDYPLHPEAIPYCVHTGRTVRLVPRSSQGEKNDIQKTTTFLFCDNYSHDTGYSVGCPHSR